MQRLQHFIELVVVSRQIEMPCMADMSPNLRVSVTPSTKH